MRFNDTYKEDTDEIVTLFASTFANSEGEEEGRIIGQLANDLLSKTGEKDIFVFSALDEGALAGAIAFTRLTFPDDPRTVFLLSPVAVATTHQGKGIGQKLIAHGLGVLRENGVDAVLTYGDINFYARVGFAQISEEMAKAPLPLQYPEGWLGQSLSSPELKPLAGPSYCVEAFNDPSYW